MAVANELSRRRTTVLLWAFLGCVATALAAPADFPAAMKLYQEQDLAAARSALQDLAELGEARAQALLGRMLMQGEGGGIDTATGLGWLMAAAENGSKPMQDQVAVLRENIAALPKEQQRAAYDVLTRYGANTLLQQLLPTTKDLTLCAGAQWGKQFEQVIAVYPRAARFKSQNADVLFQIRVGTDGLAREPEVLAAFPPGEEFVNPAMRAVLLSRFRPATVDGHAVEGFYRYPAKFRIQGGGVLWNDSGVTQSVANANAGNPEAQFLVGSAAIVDSQEFHIPYGKALELLVKSAQAGNPHAQYWLGMEFSSRAICGPSEKAARWLDIAARNGEPTAQVRRARKLLAGDNSEADRADAKRLLSAAARSDSVFAARQAIGILASTPFDDVRDPALAASVLHDLKVDEYAQDPQTWEAVAAVHAARGEFRDAHYEEDRAIKLAQDYRWNTTAMEERQAAYSAKKPWTGDLLASPPVPEPGPGPSSLRSCITTNFNPPCVWIQ
jgi:TPR repeat protein